MGKKLSWETAEQLGALNNHNGSIYAPHNKYGYKLNVNHPDIRPLYEHYKRRIGAVILSDSERFRFEAAVMKMIGRRKTSEQSDTDGQADS